MSLLPRICRIQDDFTPLGKKVERPAPPKPDPVKEFETIKHDRATDATGVRRYVGEDQCQQKPIKWFLPSLAQFKALEAFRLRYEDEFIKPLIERTFDVIGFDIGKADATAHSLRYVGDRLYRGPKPIVHMFDQPKDLTPVGNCTRADPPQLTVKDLEAAKAVLEGAWKTPEPEWSDWIEWNGGECPIPDAVAFSFEARDPRGNIYSACDADDFDWGWSSDKPAGGDFVAYRVRL